MESFLVEQKRPEHRKEGTTMSRKTPRLFLTVALLSSIRPPGFAADWLTFGHDPQRTGWASAENKLSTENVALMELKWKAAVKNVPKSLTALTAPVVASDVTTEQGSKTLVYVAGSSIHLFALDGYSGKLVWSRTFETASVSKSESFWLCPNGINATPTIDRTGGIIYAIASDGRLFGLDLGTGKVRFGPIQFVAPFSKNWSLNLVEGVIYTSLSQGCGNAQSGLYSMDVRNPFRPVIRGLLVSDRGTSGIWGRGGPVVGKNHKVFAATGDGEFDPASHKYGSSVIAASLRDLELQDFFTPLNWRDVNRYDWDLSCTSPVWFAHKNWNLISVGGKEGVVYLMDADNLGNKDHHTPLYTTPRLGNDEDTFEGRGIWGALSAWQDARGDSWVYVPIWGPVSKHAPRFPKNNGPNPNGSIMAFKIGMDSPAQPLLEPAWISGDLNVPEPVVIANGVLFTLSSGENVRQSREGGLITSKPTALSNAQRKENTSRAVLFALDAQSGNVLYQSGEAFDTWVHFSGLAVANGRVYAVDSNSQVYCFGLKEQ
jgi:outer membrane protein assembly factor BamB